MSKGAVNIQCGKIYRYRQKREKKSIWNATFNLSDPDQASQRNTNLYGTGSAVLLLELKRCRSQIQITNIYLKIFFCAGPPTISSKIQHNEDQETKRKEGKALNLHHLFMILVYASVLGAI